MNRRHLGRRKGAVQVQNMLQQRVLRDCGVFKHGKAGTRGGEEPGSGLKHSRAAEEVGRDQIH